MTPFSKLRIHRRKDFLPDHFSCMFEVTNQGLEFPAGGTLPASPTLQEFLQAAKFVAGQCELAGHHVYLCSQEGQTGRQPFLLVGCQWNP